MMFERAAIFAMMPDVCSPPTKRSRATAPSRAITASRRISEIEIARCRKHSAGADARDYYRRYFGARLIIYFCTISLYIAIVCLTRLATAANECLNIIDFEQSPHNAARIRDMRLHVISLLRSWHFQPPLFLIGSIMIHAADAYSPFIMPRLLFTLGEGLVTLT